MTFQRVSARETRAIMQPRSKSARERYIDAQAEAQSASAQAQYWAEKKAAAELEVEAAARAIVLGNSYE